MNLCVKLEDGREVTAPTEEWLAALVAMLPRPQRDALFERMERKLIGYKTPGNYILRAEPGHFGLRR